MGIAENSDKEYVKVNEKAAVRWCSPEALSDGRYGSESDTWAFGILVHEIFTYGGLPYETLERAFDVVEYVMPIHFVFQCVRMIAMS